MINCITSVAKKIRILENEIVRQALKCLDSPTCLVEVCAEKRHNADMDKKKIFLLLWLGGMLFPLNLLIKPTSLARQVFRAALYSELSHVVMHILLFSGLVFLLFLIFDLPLTKRSAVMLGICVLAVGLGQEYFQLQVKGRTFGGPEIFDLGVDLVGGTLGWIAYRTFQHYRRYLRIAYFILRNARPT